MESGGPEMVRQPAESRSRRLRTGRSCAPSAPACETPRPMRRTQLRSSSSGDPVSAGPEERPRAAPGTLPYCEQLAWENFRTGCSSIAFGATPVCPCGMSKNPTPVTVAVPFKSLKSLDADGGFRRMRSARSARTPSAPSWVSPGAGASRIGELHDHRLLRSARNPGHQMDVAVVLELELDQSRPHPVDRWRAG
jgi:hypothetical protein